MRVRSDRSSRRQCICRQNLPTRRVLAHQSRRHSPPHRGAPRRSDSEPATPGRRGGCSGIGRSGRCAAELGIHKSSQLPRKRHGKASFSRSKTAINALFQRISQEMVWLAKDLRRSDPTGDRISPVRRKACQRTIQIPSVRVTPDMAKSSRNGLISSIISWNEAPS